MKVSLLSNLYPLIFFLVLGTGKASGIMVSRRGDNGQLGLDPDIEGNAFN